MENYIIDPLESKEGRITVLLIFALFIGVFSSHITRTPVYNVFLVYCLSLGFAIYKTWGAYYDFAKYYRKKVNPDFSLTLREHGGLYIYNLGYPNITFRVYQLIWASHKDKKLNALAEKVRHLMIISFFLPIICFAVSILVVNTFGWD